MSRKVAQVIPVGLKKGGLARSRRLAKPWLRLLQGVKAGAPAAKPAAGPAAAADATSVPAPLAGNIFKVNVQVGDAVSTGQVIVLLEAMKMETEVRAPQDGKVASVEVKAGDVVAVGDTLITLA